MSQLVGPAYGCGTHTRGFSKMPDVVPGPFLVIGISFQGLRLLSSFLFIKYGYHFTLRLAKYQFHLRMVKGTRSKVNNSRLG